METLDNVENMVNTMLNKPTKIQKQNINNANIQNKPVNPFGNMNQNININNNKVQKNTNNNLPVNPFADMNSNPYAQNFESSPYQQKRKIVLSVRRWQTQ